MAIVSTFCKKGGVGKTTFIGYLGHFLAKQGKKVLIVSADDQNSIFKIFGADDKIFESDDNYLEFYIAGKAELGDLLIEVRDNLYLIKTLNTDKLSMKLTYERSQEKILKSMFKEYSEFFDYILIDFPPSSSRLTEILLEISDGVCIVVGLDTLGLGGFWNTIQYFIDNDLDIDSIKFIIPNGFAKNKRAPKVSMDILTEQVKEFTPNAVLLNPLQDRSIVKNIQAEGKSAFDEMDNLTAWDLLNKNMLQYELLSLYKQMGFEVSDEELNKYKVDEPEQKATKAKKSTKKSAKTTKTTKKSKKE